MRCAPQRDAGRRWITWTPDGTTVALAASVPGAEPYDPYRLFTIRLRDRKIVQLTRGTSAKVADGAPRWSPGGGWIAFTRSDPRHEAVHVVRPDGSGERLVARNARGAAWSPAGDRLAVLEGVTAESRRLTLSVVGVRSRERRALVRLRVRLDGAALGPQSWRPPAGAR